MADSLKVSGSYVSDSNTVFPDWKTNTSFANYATAKAALVAATSQTNDVNTYAFPANLGVSGSEGAVVHPNGLVYACATASSGILVFDPFTNTSRFIATAQTGYLSPVLARNGKIYMMPGISRNAIGVYDPSNNDFYEITASIGAFSGASNWFNGACVARYNGHIIAAPGKSGVILDINPASLPGSRTGDTFATYGSISTSSATFYCASATNGPGTDNKIYMIPFDGTKIYVYDPSTNLVTTPFADVSATAAKWASGVVSTVNGCIYCGQYTNGAGYGCLKIDTVNLTATTPAGIGTITGGYGGGCELLDGKLWFSNQGSTVLLVIDPTNDTKTETVSVGFNGYIGMVMVHDGRGVLIPNNRANVVTIKSALTYKLNDNIVMNPVYNKGW